MDTLVLSFSLSLFGWQMDKEKTASRIKVGNSMLILIFGVGAPRNGNADSETQLYPEIQAAPRFMSYYILKHKVTKNMFHSLRVLISQIQSPSLTVSSTFKRKSLLTVNILEVQ